MGNSNTDHSRKLRQITAEKAAKALKDAGGGSIKVCLSPDNFKFFKDFQNKRAAINKILDYIRNNNIVL